MLGMGILSLGNEVSVFFFAVALLISALLPTYFSYRCYIDKEVLKISYFILCYKVKKETLWKDVAYKTVKRDSDGNPQSIRLLDANKKTPPTTCVLSCVLSSIIIHNWWQKSISILIVGK